MRSLLVIAWVASAVAANCRAEASPHYSRVSGSEISLLFSNKNVIPSQRYSQNQAPVGEGFAADHKWHISLESFSLKQMSGTWETEGDRLCVFPDSQPKFCRVVWRNDETGELSMTMLPGWSHNDTPAVLEIWGIGQPYPYK
jgi:hypothetical protein